MIEIEQVAKLKKNSGFGDLILSSACFTPVHWKTGFVAGAEPAH